MTNRINLTPQTWIEDGMLYTKDSIIGMMWVHNCDDAETEVEERELLGPNADAGATDKEPFVYGVITAYKAPLLSAHEHCYRYREGEPWCGVFHGSDRDGFALDVIAAIGPEHSLGDVPHAAHLNAALLCGGSADSLRAYLDAVEEVREDQTL